MKIALYARISKALDRASYGQFLKNIGADIEIVFRYIGPQTMKSIECFWYRLRREAIFQGNNSLFLKYGGSISPLVEKEREMSCYV